MVVVIGTGTGEIAKVGIKVVGGDGMILRRIMKKNIMEIKSITIHFQSISISPSITDISVCEVHVNIITLKPL